MSTLSSTLDQLLSVPTIIFVTGGTIAVVSVVATVTGSVLRTRSRERTRREIAAYVAEGSIDADKAAELLDAGDSSKCGL